MTPTTTLLDVASTLESTTGVSQYLLVFALAMVPAVEPFVVIPVAIGLGLDPFLTGVAAFGGSVAAVVAIVLARSRLTEWWRRQTGTDVTNASDRYGRARRVWKRYGLAGLAVAGPILAGIHLTALLASVVGPDDRVTIAWLVAGLAAWTGALVAASVAGLSVLGIS
ncbi:small multi-drug export protein [Halobiforma lacisalsi AJ5]|uniref:Small multi-drug export protein n=1 Tax=Natronobacterium lacisalsi AJ5 TaxID=358396 RepID=M0L4Z2_NATLA|nr:small multi-drug export protein [Halobiforma lacisalsi]APW98075.1 small multi-drug export protein [Halobiforma lacisalsi AJ5]EMA28631.1 hypothetical protein C445_18451 [Halobiforma lacisalsi AJ5]